MFSIIFFYEQGSHNGNVDKEKKNLKLKMAKYANNSNIEFKTELSHKK